MSENVPSVAWRKKEMAQNSCQIAGIVCGFCALCALPAFWAGRVAAGCVFVVVSIGLAWATRYFWRKIGALELEFSRVNEVQRLNERKNNGLMKLTGREISVAESEWLRSNAPHTDWVEGEPKLLLLGDKVFHWNHRIASGLAVERGGKVVAVRVLANFSSFPAIASK